MTQLIDRSDPRYFIQTSDAPYDRHHYRLNFSDGTHKIYDAWDLVQSEWFQRLPTSVLHIDVLDIPNKTTKKTNGGFK